VASPRIAEIVPIIPRIHNILISELSDPAKRRKKILPLGIQSCPIKGIKNRNTYIFSSKNVSILMSILYIIEFIE
jgi:hypothetical protein